MPDAMPDASGSKAAMLAELRGRIRRMEGIGGGDGGRVLPLGVPALDEALPDGGLPLACLHELIGNEEPFNAAATGFGAAILSRIAGRGGEQGGQVVWITRGADLYAPGIAA